MNRISRNVHIVFRAERIIARRQMAVLVNKMSTMAFAGLVAGIGVIMINVAAFYWLAESMTNAQAALIVAVVNIVMAILLALIASRMNVDRELEPVTEVRDLALEDIEAELATVVEEAREVADNVRSIARDPLGTVGPALLGPLLGILTKSLKK